MGKLIGKHLKGSTLIEVITASIIFMVVFIASFSVLSVLTPANTNAIELIDADYRTSLIFRELSDGIHADGEYTTQYSWGKINATLEPYLEYPDLQQLSITVTFNNNRKLYATQRYGTVIAAWSRS